MKRLYRMEPPVVRIAAKSGMDAGLQSTARIALIITGIVAALAALDFGQAFLAPVCLAVVTGLMASPVASALERLIPASLAAAIVVVLFVGLIGSAVALFSMPLSIWTDRLPEIWHEVQRHMLNWRTVFDTLGGVQEQIRSIAGGYRRHLDGSGDRNPGPGTGGADRAVPRQPLLLPGDAAFDPG